jgi:D-tyrosyl-tRNA(Tyr) deacylase
MLLVGIHIEDDAPKVQKMAKKIVGLRIFNNPEGKMNLAITDFPFDGPAAPNTPTYDKSILAVSNFTVYGDASKSRRPSFTESAPFEKGKELFDLFVSEVRALGVEVQTGVFGAHMDVSLVNDGPVTLVVDL